MWMCLMSLSYFLIARADEMFATSSGKVRPAHCLTRRDVALFRGDKSVGIPDWRQADRIEVHFRGHKGDQEQRGNVKVCTQGDVHGPRSGHRADGGAVALMELSSCHPTLPDGVPLSSYRSGEKIHVWKYDQVLRAFREVVEKSGREPYFPYLLAFSVPSFCIYNSMKSPQGNKPTLAVGFSPCVAPGEARVDLPKWNPVISVFSGGTSPD